MTLHPDVLTDLVILYHAGEASQASRELLENESLQNPALAAALAARPRAMPPIEMAPMIREREVLKRVRQHYLYRALLAICVALALIAIFAVVRSGRPTLGSSLRFGRRPSKTYEGHPRTEVMNLSSNGRAKNWLRNDKGEDSAVRHHRRHQRGPSLPPLFEAYQLPTDSSDEAFN